MNVWILALLACAQPPTSVATATSTATSPDAGEHAAWEDHGDVVLVNNRLCAVSHTPLAAEKLGVHTSTVAYAGVDPRFSGKKLVFNQCCEMCVEKFASMWEADPDRILRYHGL